MFYRMEALISPTINLLSGSPCTKVRVRWSSLLSFRERKVDATLSLLCKKGLMTVHELRRGIETLPPQKYNSFSYFERWAVALTLSALERGTLTQVSNILLGEL